MLPLRYTCLHKPWYFLLLSSKILFKHNGRKRLFWRLSANARFKVLNSILETVLQSKKIVYFFVVFFSLNWLVGWLNRGDIWISTSWKVNLHPLEDAKHFIFIFLHLAKLSQKNILAFLLTIVDDCSSDWFVLAAFFFSAEVIKINHIYFQDGYAKENKCT